MPSPILECFEGLTLYWKAAPALNRQATTPHLLKRQL